jgi:agmatinase
MKRNFAGIEDQYAAFPGSSVLLQPVPYDGTSTWGKGADRGFEAFLDAAENMELYDIETGSEVFRQGIHILPELRDFDSPERMYASVYETTRKNLDTGKFLTTFGGEHSISIGVIKAFYERFSDITILQLDAHADLRPEYDGSPYNHACALHDASVKSHLVQVGIRSMDRSELDYLERERCFFAQEMQKDPGWEQRAAGLLKKNVYITLDLDVFDPSVLPGTGTPEPGGMDWYGVTGFLRRVFRERKVVGFDIVELAPIAGQPASQFLAAKLYYKMLSYKFFGS